MRPSRTSSSETKIKTLIASFPFWLSLGNRSADYTLLNESAQRTAVPIAELRGRLSISSGSMSGENTLRNRAIAFAHFRRHPYALPPRLC